MVPEKRVVHGALLSFHGTLPGDDNALFVLPVGAQLVVRDEHIGEGVGLEVSGYGLRDVSGGLGLGLSEVDLGLLQSG